MSTIRQVLAHVNDSPHAAQVLGIAARLAGALDAVVAADARLVPVRVAMDSAASAPAA